MNQGTPEWLQSRCGLVTASRIADVMATIKSGESASRKGYREQLVAERLTGNPAESYTNAAMQWGIENEIFARAAYELANDCIVEQVGLIPHPTIALAGASPDGLVADDGLIEIKCPNTGTHIELARSGKIPGKYQLQMLWQMACTGRQWCDFVSFDRRMPEEMQMYCIRFKRDQARIDAITAEVIEFLNEVEADVEATRLAFKKAV